jgi:hypothetical protein
MLICPVCAGTLARRCAAPAARQRPSATSSHPYPAHTLPVPPPPFDSLCPPQVSLRSPRLPFRCQSAPRQRPHSPRALSVVAPDVFSHGLIPLRCAGVWFRRGNPHVGTLSRLTRLASGGRASTSSNSLKRDGVGGAMLSVVMSIERGDADRGDVNMHRELKGRGFSH